MTTYPRRRRIAVVVLLALLAMWEITGLGPGFCSPDEYTAVTR